MHYVHRPARRTFSRAFVCVSSAPDKGAGTILTPARRRHTQSQTNHTAIMSGLSFCLAKQCERVCVVWVTCPTHVLSLNYTHTHLTQHYIGGLFNGRLERFVIVTRYNAYNSCPNVRFIYPAFFLCLFRLLIHTGKPHIVVVVVHPFTTPGERSIYFRINPLCVTAEIKRPPPRSFRECVCAQRIWLINVALIRLQILCFG